jgi:hypothetical protein
LYDELSFMNLAVMKAAKRHKASRGWTFSSRRLWPSDGCDERPCTSCACNRGSGSPYRGS